MKLFKCYTEKGKSKNWTDLSLLGQNPPLRHVLGHLFSRCVRAQGKAAVDNYY